MISEEEEKSGGMRGVWRDLRKVIYGMAAHDMSRAALRTRAAPAVRGPPDLHVEAPHAAREGLIRPDVLAGATQREGAQWA